MFCLSAKPLDNLIYLTGPGTAALITPRGGKQTSLTHFQITSKQPSWGKQTNERPAPRERAEEQRAARRHSRAAAGLAARVTSACAVSRRQLSTYIRLFKVGCHWKEEGAPRAEGCSHSLFG